MQLYSTAFTILFMLCYNINAHPIHESNVRTFNRQYILPANTTSFFRQLDFGNLHHKVNDLFPYASCKTSESTETFCNVTVDTRYQLRECNNLMIRPGKTNREMVKDLYNTVVPFANNRIILMWMETSGNSGGDVEYVGFSIVNMLKCTASYSVLPFNLKLDYLYGYPLVLYSNSIDFIIEDPSACPGNERKTLCRISYDVDGKQIGTSKRFFLLYEQLRHLRPVSYSSYDHGFVATIIDMQTNELSILRLNSDGRKFKELYKTPLNETSKFVNTISSNAHECYGLFWWQGNVIKLFFGEKYCDDTWKHKIVGHVPEWNWLVTYNFIDNGPLLISGKSIENTQSNTRRYEKFKVISQATALIGEYKFDGQGLECHDSAAGFSPMIVGSSGGEEYCFYFTCAKEVISQVDKDQILQFAGTCIRNPDAFNKLKTASK